MHVPGHNTAMIGLQNDGAHIKANHLNTAQIEHWTSNSCYHLYCLLLCPLPDQLIELYQLFLDSRIRYQGFTVPN
jgi:hypothetical protein